jgi:hypothetical protein
MMGIKRSGKSRGAVLEHRFGADEGVLLGYRDARVRIDLPAYRWVLDNRLAAEVARLRVYGAGGTLVLLNYETNGDIDDLSGPLSHAAVPRCYLEGTWPVAGT